MCFPKSSFIITFCFYFARYVGSLRPGGGKRIRRVSYNTHNKLYKCFRLTHVTLSYRWRHVIMLRNLLRKQAVYLLHVQLDSFGEN